MKTFQKNLLAFSVSVAAAGFGSQALAATTTLVSITPQKIVGNALSRNVSLSKSGAQCAFESDATNLTLQDGNVDRDIFMKVGSKITRVSVNSLGQEATNSAVNWYSSSDEAGSYNGEISSDGKLVVFQSNADNLDLLTQDANNDTNNDTESDIFVRDIAKKKTYRLSGIMDGADGTLTAGQLDVFNQPVSTTDAPWKIMTQSNDWSGNPAIAGTAKQAWVAFESYATTLSPFVTSGDDHIYVVDLKTKKMELVDAQHDLSGNPTVEGNDNSSSVAISADGRFVVYESDASNLVASPVTANVTDIFIYDRKRFKTYQLSGTLTPTGTNGFVVSAEGDNDSAAPKIAGDGKSKTKSYMIAFESRATNMDVTAVPGGDAGTDRDVFVVEFAAIDPKDVNSDYEIKSQRRISSPLDTLGVPTGESRRAGNGSNSTNRAPVIAGTNLAYKVAFYSTADNLLAADPVNAYWNEDSNGTQDIYVFDSKTNAFSRANVDPTGQQGTATANSPAISGDGKMVGFDTNDSYLTPISLGAGTQVYTRK
ncbi:MAG: hypothetical protein IPN27_03765 [Cellvibrionales bacterium]|nr:hypothetical protein [Cellvibrionales bacterium]